MTKRENILSLFRRYGYSEAPVHFDLCPSLLEQFKKDTGQSDYMEYFDFPWRYVNGLKINYDMELYKKYYKQELKRGTVIDVWGVAHEPGSEKAKHMTRLVHPLKDIDSLDEIKEYPFPDFSKADESHIANQAADIKAKGLAALGRMGQTIWETSWSIRSMEDLFIDMIMEDEKAKYILDKVTESSCMRAASYARGGVDILWLGDDIGMQNSIMMSGELYRTWLKPMLKKVIDTAKVINPNLLIMYHSDGYIKPFIPDLIEIGVDILNPIQPECMDFKDIYEEFGDRLSFHGTIGIQTTMPFGSAEDVKREVYRNLNIAGEKGGLFCAPVHLLEPEVPFENIIAYVDACKSFLK